MRGKTMSDDLRDIAARAVVYQIIEQAAKERKDEARAQLSALEPGDTLAAKWDGQLLGKATMTRGKSKIVVTDVQRLVEWLQYAHPTEIVISANPAYLTTLRDVDGVVIDKDGVVVPGVELVSGTPYVSVRKEKDAPFVVSQLLSGGRIQLDGIRELEQ
jgi:hypothetical protein